MKYKLLFIDDNIHFLELFARMFKKFFEITTAENLKTAMEILDSQTFDLILCDYKMPGISGLDMMKAIQEKHPETPIVYLTGMESDEIRQQAIESGAAGFIIKDTLKPGFKENVISTVQCTIEHKCEYADLLCCSLS